MPMVPETFAPSVAQTETPMVPATGPWISPMKNRAPSLLQQTGDTLAAAGREASALGNTIGDHVQETMDAALTKSAETSFLKTSQDLLTNPQTGYLNTRGLNAQTEWDPATKAIAKARQDARATLTNPIQQHAYDLATNDHMLTIGRTMNDHQHGQVTQYGIQQGQDRADSMNLLARSALLDGRMDDYAKYAGEARDEVLHVASLNGAAPDSDVAQAMLRAKHTDLVHGIVTGLLDDHKYDQAKQYFEAERPNIDMRTGEVLGNAVKAEWDRNLTETKGDGFLAAAQTPGGTTPHTYGPLATGSTINPMTITDVPGSPRPGGRLHDGYDIAMPAGTQVTSPLDGKVVKVWDDKQFGGGLSMRVQLADGNTLGVAHLSAANLKEGDTVNRGQVVALSGRSGNATGNVLHVALTDPDGKKIDYFGASKAQPDQAGVADPDVLQRAIDMAKSDSSLDPYQQKRVVSYMEAQHSHERSIQEQQYQDVKQGAVDYYYSHNESIDGMPAEQKAKLKPQDLFNLTQPASVETDPETLANFILNPKSVTVPNVKDAYAAKKLNNGTYFSLLRDAVEGQNDPTKVMEATVEADRLKYFADQAGIPNIYKAQNEQQKKDYAGLLVHTQQDIDVAQQQKGGKLTQSEKDQIIQRNVQQHVITHLRSAWNPLAWIPGHETYLTGFRGYQVPQGATGTAKGPDGKLHFTDGKNDLGIVPEADVKNAGGGAE
jgi:murein DD-endopeptidase MepM/ murein hydrolase activator NlpD